MRRLSGLLAMGSLAITIASQASAVSLSFTGSLSLQIGAIASGTVPGGGDDFCDINPAAKGCPWWCEHYDPCSEVCGNYDPQICDPDHLYGYRVVDGIFQTTGLSLPVTDPSASPIGGIRLTASNASGAFSRATAGAPLTGVMPINGAAKVCLFGTCSAPVSNLIVPLTVVGIGGTLFATGGGVNLTVVGAPWTTGTVAVGAITAMGYAGGPSLLTSSTAQNSGMIVLVTPIFISTNIASLAVIPSFGVLSLHFVPEPGTLILLGSGITGLVAFGRSRARI